MRCVRARLGRPQGHWYLCPDTHVYGVVVELLSAFQARDVGAGRLGIGFMHGGDGSGDEPVMATKQHV